MVTFFYKRYLEIRSVWLLKNDYSNYTCSHWFVFWPGFHDTVQSSTHKRGTLCFSLYVCVSTYPVNGCTTPYDVRSTGPYWLIFDPLPWPCVSGVWTVIERTGLSKDPTEPHPETTEPLVGLPPTLLLSNIVIHHRKFRKNNSATLKWHQWHCMTLRKSPFGKSNL